MKDKTRTRIGWTLGGLAAAFLGFDCVIKFTQPRPVTDTMAQLGWPTDPGTVVGLGVVLLVSTLLYLIPRTAAIGAILLTGYLGGAVATHVRVGNPLFSHVLFPVYFGAILWAGLALRDKRAWRFLLHSGAED